MRRFNMHDLIATLIICLIFLISGAIFLTFLGFGLYGLSRILIYFKLAEFSFNKGFYQNLYYYGSYIVFGYIVFYSIEYLMETFRKKLSHSPYFQGLTFHLLAYVVSTTMFFFIIHIHYKDIDIDFWVILVISGLLYIFKEIFYPDSENLNRKRK
ncbi:SepA family multidrug efflux transporter [Staphylococcus massiliensis]|uniref:Multidrug resistance efflux pump SepA n=1 Tax=Staphylococcus massiliensis S46 TaxID=1229783 RepID=K9AEZ9_9STAP|nr:SepA family multidrug efflux transporter [Staphylococcus massiliensis]EKU45833.1 hypothetical protein C273_10597 [Staphylococcus massiliensis S46]MCG3399318.1 SepA family multidrug efflux transporter [Staphylococcus massiliensis]MCG3402580.1 SepA family multidrug efflux transporter [Staphylococcus massiliensis]MCG3413321.1 SepA family multidrug efflux transporter [Staphylococcus massiliensis]POA00658.1 multidrug resistance protein SepA [Staphylococcus massiliensis CCUG 55927]